MADGGNTIIRPIALASIRIPGQRARRLRPEVVSTLAESMKATGLLNPITVYSAGRQVKLVAGRHRLEAARMLGWKSIDARLLQRNADIALQSELAEIDENLIRADLSPAERAAHHARRKAIYEKLHPETRRGGDRKSDAATSKGKVFRKKTYAEETAAQVGRTARAVRMEVARGNAIPNVAALAGTALDKGDELDALAKLGEVARITMMKRAIAGEKVSAKTELGKERRAVKESLMAEKSKRASAQLEGAAARYGVIYADPPWQYETYSAAGKSRAPENHYPTMSLGQLCALTPPAADDAVLFLWATAPLLEHALTLGKAWLFAYSTHFVWAKDKVGTGYWNRNKHELLLVFTKGQVPAPAQGTQPASVIEAPRGRHSEKPEIFAQMIAEMFPTTPRIELFARTTRPGWASWGDEVESIGRETGETELDGIDPEHLETERGHDDGNRGGAGL